MLINAAGCPSMSEQLATPGSMYNYVVSFVVWFVLRVVWVMFWLTRFPEWYLQLCANLRFLSSVSSSSASFLSCLPPGDRHGRSAMTPGTRSAVSNPWASCS